jgi:sugar phosphate isomerase/epimerase
MACFLRQALIGAAVLTFVAGTALAEGVGTSKCYHGPTALQLYSLRDFQAKEGTEAMLDKAKSFGFKYVEVAGLGNLSPENFKKELDKRELVPVGCHFPFGRLRDDIAGVVRDAKALGLPYAGCAWIDHQGSFDEKQCRIAAKVFNQAGAALAKEGIKFYYHNHGYEFAPFGQGTLFDLLMAETDPKTVFYQMDVMWTVFPAQDPVKLIEKYPNRWLLLHLKDLRKGVPTGSLTGGTDPKNDVVLGSGQVQWIPLLQATQKVGVKYYIIEDESPTVLEQIPQSLRYLESVAW